MRVLIVDDEAPARARLRRLLAAHADVQVVAEADSGEAALQQLALQGADVLLLDIRMPGLSGLDLAASLPDPAPAVVFVTAHGDHALQAFDTAAVDYLLKPVAPERLALCLQRLRARPAAPPAPRPPPQQLLVPDRGRVHVVAVDRILWLEAADNYVVVHSDDRALAPLMRRPLAALLHDLGSGFQRCHRSAAVALRQVQQLQLHDKGDATLLLAGGVQVPCSRNHRAALVQALAARPAR